MTELTEREKWLMRYAFEIAKGGFHRCIESALATNAGPDRTNEQALANMAPLDTAISRLNAECYRMEKSLRAMVCDYESPERCLAAVKDTHRQYMAAMGELHQKKAEIANLQVVVNVLSGLLKDADDVLEVVENDDMFDEAEDGDKLELLRGRIEHVLGQLVAWKLQGFMPVFVELEAVR